MLELMKEQLKVSSFVCLQIQSYLDRDNLSEEDECYVGELMCQTLVLQNSVDKLVKYLEKK